RIRCPVLVIQGTDDAITSKDCGIALAGATGGQLVLLEGAGHGPHVRDPVKVNLLLRDFAAPAAPPSRWARARTRRKRALYISSPIGLGHAQRDVAIGDESWELDYYLHGNPEQKTAAYAWFTGFVGWLPMADGGEREAFLTADDHAEMIEHIARFPRVRDRAIFVGDPGDIVPDAFGPG